MKKTILQLIILVAVFFGIYLSLSKIDWMGVFKIEKATNKTEKKLGDAVWDLYQKTEKENKDSKALKSLDSIVTKICKDNDIDRKKILLHLIEKDEINAFAMPGNHLVVYIGLIKAADNPEEVAGVLSHEIAHIELDHVMKKIVREIGLSTLISITSGNGSGEAIKRITKSLSSLAFDRKLEKDADIKAVDYMVKANVNPNALADFLYKLSEDKGENTRYETWLSNHPDSRERSEYIVEYAKGKVEKPVPVIDSLQWNQLKKIAEE